MTRPGTGVHGHVHPRFEAVRDAFAADLADRSGTGAALAVWHDGHWVVDLWGGAADAAGDRPWQPDTLVMPYSVTKPFAAVAALMLVARGVLDLDAPLSGIWPELTAPTTLRHVLSHQAGLVALTEPAPTEAFLDRAALTDRLAAQPPTWPPGTAHGESALFFGHLVGELVRRADGRSLGRFLREEVCGPRGLDFHVGLDAALQRRTADLTGLDPAFVDALHRGRPPLFAAALGNPPGALDPAVVNSAAWRAAEVPAVNGHGTARAVAGLYVALHDGLLPAGLLAEATTGQATGEDRVLGADATWGLGVAVDPDGFGMGGIGGSVGWWSRAGGYAFGYVTGHVSMTDRAGVSENLVREALDLPPV